MDLKLKTIQSLVGELIWIDYDRLSTDGQKVMNQLCEELNIEIY